MRGVLRPVDDMISKSWKAVQKIAYGTNVCLTDWHAALCRLLYEHVWIVHDSYECMEATLGASVLDMVHALFACAADTVSCAARSHEIRTPLYAFKRILVADMESLHQYGETINNES